MTSGLHSVQAFHVPPHHRVCMEKKEEQAEHEEEERLQEVPQDGDAKHRSWVGSQTKSQRALPMKACTRPIKNRSKPEQRVATREAVPSPPWEARVCS